MLIPLSESSLARTSRLQKFNKSNLQRAPLAYYVCFLCSNSVTAAGSSHSRSSFSAHKFTAQISAQYRGGGAHKRFASSTSFVLLLRLLRRSFALKFHLVLKAFLYVRFDCFSASLLLRLGRLLRVFFVHSCARLTLTSFLVVIAHTSLSAAQCLLFRRRRRRYKIRSSVFGGLPTTTSQNGVASLSAFYLALLSRTHTL